MYCVSAISIFDTAFLSDCTKFCSVFSGYWIGNLMRIPKMCLKQSFSHFKWVWQFCSWMSNCAQKFSCSIRYNTCFWDFWQWSRDCL